MSRSHLNWLVCALAVVLCVGVATSAVCAAPPVRTVDGGRISGAADDGVIRFLGVPYAAPPIGDLRWREPQPVRPWTGVREATAFAPACAQRGARQDMSEDCLYLNVWAPAAARGPLPVIVWIHGGGFNVGGTSEPAYDGAQLARKGVVVVSVGYRLGLLASLALPELTAESPHKTSGANQMLDQIAALHWVKRNIAAFGGDAGDVTLMGHSSGSINVSALLTSPLAKGLFTRAVALSGNAIAPGGPWPLTTLKEAEEKGEQAVAGLGAPNLAALRALPTDRVVGAVRSAFPTGIDGYVLTEAPAAAYAAGRQIDIPILMSGTRDESFSAVGRITTLAEYRAALARIAGSLAPQLERLFPASNDAEAAMSARRLANAGEFSRQMAMWAFAQARTSRAPAYLLVFASGANAPHGADVPYYFGTVPKADPAARALSERMMAILVAFAKTGDPATPDIRPARFDPAAPKRTVLDTVSRVEGLDPGLQFLIEHPEIQIGLAEPSRPPAGAR